MNQWLGELSGTKEFLDTEVTAGDYFGIFKEYLKIEVVAAKGKDSFKYFQLNLVHSYP